MRWRKVGATAALVVLAAILGLLALPSVEPTACQRWQQEYTEAEARLDREVPTGFYRYQPPASKALFEVADRRPGLCPFP